MMLLPDGQVADHPPKQFKWPLFRLAFRPLFLLGALFSIVSLSIWTSWLKGLVSFSLYGGGLWWHIHEMLFGFVIAIVTGFLLTAVQTWTKQDSVKGWPLVLLVACWLLSRIFLLLPEHLPAWLIILVDLLYLPIAALLLLKPILKVRQWRNLFFVPVLLIMAVVNAGFHWITLSKHFEYLLPLAYSMVMLVALIMCVMGGRVFPMFTANGTRTEKAIAIGWLEKVSIAGVILCIPIATGLISIPGPLTASVFFVAALANGIRAFRWRIWVTLRVPLVWSLHLSYWSIVLGLFLFGLAQVTSYISTSQAIHCITVGGMGGMILAMISRVSLGHTGRMIQTDWVMAIAFAAINLAFLVRVFSSLIVVNYLHILICSTLLWVLAFGIFLYRYPLILCRSRLDGRPE